MIIMFDREVSKRVFVKELLDSNYTRKDDDSKMAPNFVITPTGAKVNRIFAVLTITETENVGKDFDFWRARATDPTGTIYVNAGQYQPDAMQVLSTLATPAFVAVTGKPALREWDDENGETHLSITIRPEVVQVVTEKERNKWVYETARLTLERIIAFESFLAGPKDDGFKQADEVTPDNPEAAIIADAYNNYGTDLLKLSDYREVVRGALLTIVSSTDEDTNPQNDDELYDEVPDECFEEEAINIAKAS